MSQTQITEPFELLTTALPSDPSTSEGNRHIRAVPNSPVPRPQRSPLFLAIAAVLMVLTIFGAQLWLSVATSQGAYEVNALVIEQQGLDRSERALKNDVEKLASPQFLAENALKLGMVQNARPAYLQLQDATVLGSFDQATTAPNENLIANAALTELTAPEKTKKEAKVTEEAKDSKKIDTETQAIPRVQKPITPVPWKGKLSVPKTH